MDRDTAALMLAAPFFALALFLAWNFRRNLGVIASAIVLVLGIAVVGNADCRNFFRHQVIHQPSLVAQPVVLYQAGVGVEQDALAERIAQRVEARILARLQAPQQLTQPPATQTALGQHCAKCHSGATPKAGLVFDGTAPIDPAHITAALRQIRDDKMPKGKSLDPASKGAVMDQLLDLEREAVLPAPEPAPGELK